MSSSNEMETAYRSIDIDFEQKSAVRVRSPLLPCNKYVCVHVTFEFFVSVFHHWGQRLVYIRHSKIPDSKIVSEAVVLEHRYLPFARSSSSAFSGGVPELLIDSVTTSSRVIRQRRDLPLLLPLQCLY